MDRRAACSCSAARVRPDTSTGTVDTGIGSGSGSGSTTGACSMIAWALVPLSPNEDTAARRGSPVSGHGVFSVTSRTAPADQSTCEDGSSTSSVRGTTPLRIAMTILMTPATPAAACVWLMLDFTEPSSSGRCSSRLRP
ncbi:hypothetical protein GCM10027597_47050 [Saccharopolyspora tripterygii]